MKDKLTVLLLFLMVFLGLGGLLSAMTFQSETGLIIVAGVLVFGFAWAFYDIFKSK